MNRLRAYLALIPAALLIAVFVLGPLLLVLRVSLYQPADGRLFFTPGTLFFGNYAALTDGYGLRLVGFTAAFGLTVAMCVVLTAFPLALFLRALPPRWQSIALALILIPKTAGLLATLFGLQRLLPRGLPASILAEIYLIQPYAVLALFVHLRSLDPAWEQAARGLGANRWTVFRRVTLPLSLPGLVVAFEFGLMWGLGAFLGPLFLGGPEQMTMSVEIHRQAFEYGRWPRAAALAVGLLALTAVLLLAARAIPNLRRSVQR